MCLICCFEAENREGIVRFFYEKETEDWHRWVHKRGGTAEENINETVATISDDSVMYEVRMGDDLAAFFVIYDGHDGNALEGFHVGKSYRNKDFLSDFWGIVKGKFNGEFMTGICRTNEEALNHLLKNGFEIIGEVMDKGKPFFILKFKL